MCRLLSATNFTQMVMKLGFHVALCAEEHCHKFTHSAQDSKQHTNTTFRYNVQTVNDKLAISHRHEAQMLNPGATYLTSIESSSNPDQALDLFDFRLEITADKKIASQKFLKAVTDETTHIQHC